MGVVSPYMGWWIDQVSSPAFRPLLLGCFYATMIITPSLWSHAAFSSSRPGQWLSMGTLLTALFALGLSQVETSSIIASCFLILSFGLFYTPLLSLLDALAYSQLEDASAYSRVRLYGSWGFLVFSTFVGGFVVLDNYKTFPFVVGLIMVFAWVASIPYKKTIFNTGNLMEHPSEKGAFRSVFVKLYKVWIAMIISQIAFVMYYVFFAIYLKNLGFSNVQVGALVGVATLAEIVSFWKIKWFFEKATPWNLIAISSFLTALRWGVIGLMGSGTWFIFVIIFVVQLLHALSFSVFHTSCLKIIHESVAPQHMGLAQGAYNAIGYGVGGLLGVFIGSFVWSQYGGHVLFEVCAVLSFFLSGLAFFFAKPSALQTKIL